MRKYLSQKDDYRCGPIAVANFIHWMGMNKFNGKILNRKMVNGYLTRVCRCNSDCGAEMVNVARVVRRVPGIYCEAESYFTASRIFKHVNAGQCAILMYKPIKSDGAQHYCLVVQSEKEKHVKFINAYEDPVEDDVPYDDMKKIIKESDKVGCLCGLFISLV